jgi:hypothetical protein
VTKGIRKSAAYRAVVDGAKIGPPWVNRVVGLAVIGLGVYLRGWQNLGDWPTVVVIGGGLWLFAPDADEAIARVLGAWKGGGNGTPTD